MNVEDLEEEDLDDEPLPSTSTRGQAPAWGSSGGERAPPSKGRGISVRQAAELKDIIFGNRKQKFNSAWMQGFFQSKAEGLGYGVVQTAGGPCGVLATVQAFLLRDLLVVERLGDSVASISPAQFKRSLVKGLSYILWQAGGGHSAVVAVMSGKRTLSGDEEGNMISLGYKPDGFTEHMTLYEGRSVAEIEDVVNSNIRYFMDETGPGIPMFLYSAVLSRGLERVRGDMEALEGSCRLMGQHDYCSQEMVNLMLVGRAVQQVFDGVKDLDGLKLTGIHKKGEVGLLTLFEHYGSMHVGENLKEPIHPIWVICSESHFSVLFGTNPSSVKRVSQQGGTMDLLYYDELSKQEAPIKLTVNWDTNAEPLAIIDFDKDLTPPLEHCIRTRFPAASVDWNGTDPIL